MQEFVHRGTLLTRGTRDSQIRGHRKQHGNGQGLGDGRDGELAFNGHRVLVNRSVGTESTGDTGHTAVPDCNSVLPD